MLLLKSQQLSSQYYAHDDLQAVCVLRRDSFFFFNISNLMLLCGWGFRTALVVVSFLLLYFSFQVASS